ncbi:hypothetical protein DAC23_248 [Bacteroides phage DAC23]|nr:hypothetical protein DAC23_248 [Bacteroides phage DAC23]
MATQEITFEELKKQFNETYSYVSVDDSVIKSFLKSNKKIASVDLLYDYILSQGLEDEVEL